MTIDLNCDVGELSEVPEAGLMPLITSCNIACGGHAGDDVSMERTLRLALEHEVACGAHPSYPDRANFGRITLPLAPEAIAKAVSEQILSLVAIADELGVPVRHVKPHGALYNDAATNPVIARAIAAGASVWSKDVTLVGLAGSVMLDTWREAGLKVASEGFADRAYESNGTLRSRTLAGSLITDPTLAAAQALRLARSGTVQTLCVHSDTPDALSIVQAIHRHLTRSQVAIRSFTI